MPHDGGAGKGGCFRVTVGGHSCWPLTAERGEGRDAAWPTAPLRPLPLPLLSPYRSCRSRLWKSLSPFTRCFAQGPPIMSNTVLSISISTSSTSSCLCFQKCPGTLFQDPRLCHNSTAPSGQPGFLRSS